MISLKKYAVSPLYYADLERVRLEKAEKCENEHFMFALIDKDGKRVYGMCMRALFQGESKRFDLRRRPRHCLCIISRHPFISLFRTLLLQIHSLSMLEQQPGSAKTFVELAYTQSLALLQLNSERITITRAALPDLAQDFNILSPRRVRLSRVATILPLLEMLGVEKFLLILSAVLCERRIILIADDTSTLFTAVLALGAMLHPFQWQHIFIPSLPLKLMSYTAVRTPYIIGVRRYMYQQLLREQLDDVILVDIDKGDYRVVGGMCIRDFVGESGTALKQATESLDRVRQRASDMASMFLRNTGASSNGIVLDADSGPRDIAAIIVNDLRAALASKPGGSSVTAVASGLFRSLPGGVKSTVEENKGVWAMETEKLLRDTLLQFFVYLFADLEDYLSPVTNPANKSVVAAFDRKGFMNKRVSTSIGDSRAILDFLSDFLQSKSFGKFCDERLAEKRERTGSESSGSGWGRGSGLPSTNAGNSGDEEDDFHAVCADLRGRQLTNSVANVRSAVASRTAMTAASLNADSSNGACKGFVGMDFHPLAVQYTLGQKDGNYESESSESSSGAVDRICSEAHQSDAFSKIMHTIALRLENCRAAVCRGAGGQAGVRALNLLRALLITGPECVLSASLDHIPGIRVILSQCGGGALPPQGLDFMSLGPVADIRIIALAVLSLLLDHKKLVHQRKFSLQCREGVYPYLLLQPLSSTSSLFSPANHQKMHKRLSDSLKRDLLIPVSPGVKRFPPFGTILQSCKPSGVVSIEPSTLILTEPVAASSEKREEDEDDDGNEPESTSTRDSSAPLCIQTQSSLLLENFLDDPFETSPVEQVLTPSLNPMIASFQPSVPNKAPAPASTFFNQPTVQSSPSAPAPVHAPTPAPVPVFGSTIGSSPSFEKFDEDAIYRIVNQDTGEVHDLRDLDKMMSISKVSHTPAKHHVPTLAPPPPPATTMRRPPARVLPSQGNDVYAVSAAGTTSNGSVNSYASNGNGNGNGSGRGQAMSPSTDPFATLTPLIPNSPPVKAPQSLVQSRSSPSFTPSYSHTATATSFVPSVSSSSSSNLTSLAFGSNPVMNSSGGRPPHNDIFSPSSSVINPFQGLEPSPSQMLTPRGTTPTQLSPRGNSQVLTPRGGTMGMNSQQAARDKAEETINKPDPFADLLRKY
jgi:DENN (AEX-3) domain